MNTNNGLTGEQFFELNMYKKYKEVIFSLNFFDENTSRKANDYGRKTDGRTQWIIETATMLNKLSDLN